MLKLRGHCTNTKEILDINYVECVICLFEHVCVYSCMCVCLTSEALWVNADKLTNYGSHLERPHALLCLLAIWHLFQSRGEGDKGKERGVLMVGKVGGSRGNPPCVGPFVSCHWRSALRVEDCIAWCIEGTSHVLSLLSLLLSVFFFLDLSQAVSHKRCRCLLVQMESPPPPKWGQRESEGGEGERFENRNHINTSFFFLFFSFWLASLWSCLWAHHGNKWVIRKCHYHGGNSFPPCLHTVHSASQTLTNLTDTDW